MENICTNIRKNNLKDLLKWMTGLEEKDRELLRSQLPPSDSDRLFFAWNKGAHSNFIKDTPIAHERCSKFFDSWLMSSSRPVDMRGPLAGAGSPATLLETSSVVSYEYPVPRSTPLDLRPVSLHSAEPYSPSIYTHSIQPYHHFTVSTQHNPSFPFNPTTATNSQALLVHEESYRPTWTENEVDAIWKRKLSQRFSFLDPGRLSTLYENLRNENFMTQLSRDSLEENSVFGYHYTGENADI